MMTTNQARGATLRAAVMTTDHSDRYHVDEACPGYRQGVRNSERLGRKVWPARWVSETEAQAEGKTPCLRCGGSR
jgi:hypothetical protein